MPILVAKGPEGTSVGSDAMADDTLRGRRVIAVLAVLACLAASTATFSLAKADAIQPAPLPWALALSAWWSAPLGLYAWTSRRSVLLAVVAVGYLAAVAMM